MVIRTVSFMKVTLIRIYIRQAPILYGVGGVVPQSSSRIALMGERAPSA